ncbi:hypothetical protein THAOC_18546 [Thalassiosira oceanica]|uniref:Uncharacterized protein n=1 Tax=Thalassiosira oceanica TaxID=159749 RepID=K0S7X3_THAOC|nr:hypothetical protein THAOC_18546 [Thalassiosira oceanica]|eukprot:EJK61024.1 hypothetical protein THAOC_18546 [Thalassiosira oceanica]
MTAQVESPARDEGKTTSKCVIAREQRRQQQAQLRLICFFPNLSSDPAPFDNELVPTGVWEIPRDTQLLNLSSSHPYSPSPNEPRSAPTCVNIKSVLQ